MRKLIEQLRKVTEDISNDYEEITQIGAKFKFGSMEWQQAMLDRIKRKLTNKEELIDADRAFIEIQLSHNKKIMAELKTMGLPNGISPN